MSKHQGAPAAHQHQASHSPPPQQQHPQRLSRVIWSAEGLSIGSVLDSAFELGEALFRRRTPHVSLDWTSGFVCGGQRWRMIAAPEHLIEEAARSGHHPAATATTPAPTPQQEGQPPPTQSAGRSRAPHTGQRPQSAHASINVPSTIAEVPYDEQEESSNETANEQYGAEAANEEEHAYAALPPPVRSGKANHRHANPNLAYYATAGADPVLAEYSNAPSYYEPPRTPSSVHNGYSYPSSAQRQAPVPVTHSSSHASKPPRPSSDTATKSRPASSASSGGERPAVPATRASMSSSATKGFNGSSQTRRSSMQ
jgi:hypothetical protein